MPARQWKAALRRREARLWTGGGAHLLGGTLDLLQALLRYRLTRRGAPARPRRRAGGAAARMHPSKR